MGWVRKHPELVILGAFVIVVAVTIVRYQTRSSPQPGTVGVPLASSPAVVQPLDSDSALAAPSSAVPVVPSSPGAVASSAAPAPAKPSPSALTSDNPAFDQAGDGPDCSMTYGNGPDGNALTMVALAVPGTLVTHVDGPGGQHIHTQAEPKGSVSFAYGFPLGQAAGMGAIFYPVSGPREQCAIGPAR